MGVCISKRDITTETPQDFASRTASAEDTMADPSLTKPQFKRTPSSNSSTFSEASRSSLPNINAERISKSTYHTVNIENLFGRRERRPSVESVEEVVRETGLTDEEWDDLQLVRILFDEIDENKNGILSKDEIENYLKKNHKNEELCQVLVKLTESSADISFDSFRETVRHIPRVIGQRVNWVGTLNFAPELAKHLRPGTIFDGLQGIREEMTIEDIKKACAKFCSAVPGLVIRAWETLRQKKQIKAEDVNSKFTMGEGTTRGLFGTLDDFYKGPEARIGHPNPKLYEAMEREHTRRASALKLFTTQNYLVTTCTQWEWHWVVNPFLFPCQSLKDRMAISNGKYPGEVGDMYSETHVQFDLDLDSYGNSEKYLRILENDLTLQLIHLISQTPESISKGVRILEFPTHDHSVVSMTVALPFPKSEFDLKIFQDALAQILGIDADKINCKKIWENIFEYCEFADETQFETALLSKSDADLRSFLTVSMNWQANDSLKFGVKSAVQNFLHQSEAWNVQNKFRKQGRVKTFSSIDNLVAQADIHEMINKAKLRKEEIIALRLYTGPNYLIYNATLRGSPQQIVDILSGNKMETTIFVLISGLVKLAKVTEIPQKRFLYRGLGGMLLPEEFWNPASELQGGVELGLMSTTMDKRIAIQYSGLEKKRAIIFEIMAGRIDIGGSLGFISQYPGEAEYLMPPLTCLEVMGRPRVEMTDKGEVIVFPMRANVNLKSMTVEQLENRRKELHLAIVTNLQEELFQWLEAVKAEAEVIWPSNQLQDTMIPAIVTKIKDEFKAISTRHHSLQPQDFNDEDIYKELMVEAIDAKVLAMRKMDFYKKELEESNLAWDMDFLQRVIDTSLKEFYNKGIELQLRTGIKDFPWQDVIAQKASIDLGEWSPLGLEPWKLDKTRLVLAQNDAIRGVTIKGQVIPFQHGILAEEINLDNQPVTGIAAELGFLFSVNTRLSSLSLRGNGLSCRDWSQLLGALQECKSLVKVNGGDFTDALAEGQVALDLRGRSIDRDAAAVVGGLLIRSASTLTSLNLSLSTQDDKSERKSFNDISKEGGTAISEGLQYAVGLQILNLSYNGLSKEGATAIAASLSHLTSLLSLDLRSNGLGKEGGMAIAQGLQNVCFLEYLDLQGNDLAKEGGTAIANALEHVPALKTLDISSNRLTKEGGSAISIYLRNISNLQTLNLSSNGLSKDGAIDMAEDLRFVSHLLTLDLQGNDLAKEGATAIAKGLRHISFLQSLNISFNALSKEGGTAIAEGLHNVTSMLDLNLGSNGLSKEGATAIAHNLRHVTMLRSLDLRLVGSWNEIANEGATAIAEALRFSTSLHTLNLRFNRLDADGEWRIRNKLTAVKSLLLTS